MTIATEAGFSEDQVVFPAIAAVLESPRAGRQTMAEIATVEKVASS